MSSKNDIKVRSQGGLKVQRLFDILDEEIQHKPEEVIVHVGVNNIENDNVEELIENFNAYLWIKGMILLTIIII